MRFSLHFLTLLLGGSLLISACSPNPDTPPSDEPAMPGSDAEAVALADAVMHNMGGRENWDDTRIIAWHLFGRDHVWDKQTGDYRMQNDSLVVLMNVNSREGRAWHNGEEITDPAMQDEVLQMAYRAWVNEGYWFLMPFKLKDPGVTLTYMGEDTMATSQPADMIALTFDSVGLTPQNKYHVWIGQESGLVEQWAFYREASDAEPSFVRPWTDYRSFGDVRLAVNRGEGGNGQPLNIENVAILDTPTPGLFDDPRRVDLATLAGN